MSLTPNRLLVFQTIGKFLSAMLTLAMIIQPVSVGAQTAGDLEVGPTLTVGTGDLGVPAEPVQGPAEPPTVQAVLLSVCEARGYGEECAKTLLGMMWKESRNDAKAVGDHGRAQGYFQIWYRLHNITLDCAQDLQCSADWTLKYMEQHGYPRYPAYAIQCHNGCNIRNGYAASVLRNASRLWPEPMTLAIAQ